MDSKKEPGQSAQFNQPPNVSVRGTGVSRSSTRQGPISTELIGSHPAICTNKSNGALCAEFNGQSAL